MEKMLRTSVLKTLNSYGVRGIFSLAFDLVRTRIWFHGARVIRFPIHIRGKQWINFGSRFSTGRDLRIEAFGDENTKGPLIRFGSDVRINDSVHIGAIESISIGDRVLIASKVYISDHNHGSYGKNGIHSSPSVPPNDRPLFSSPVVIEDDVWIGEFVSVLPGVRIGKGSIIGTLTTVTKDVPPYCIAVGSPARIIKRFNAQTSEWEPA